MAALIASAALAGCLGSDSGGQAAQNVGPAFGTPIRLADCSDWLKARPSARSAFIDGVEAVSGGPTGSPAGHGRTLPDDKAYNLFEVNCRQPYAKRFILYHLYTRAAAFQGATEGR